MGPRISERVRGTIDGGGAAAATYWQRLVEITAIRTVSICPPLDQRTNDQLTEGRRMNIRSTVGRLIHNGDEDKFKLYCPGATQTI